jgi:hypothetical protein
MERQVVEKPYLTPNGVLNKQTESLGFSEIIDVKRQLFEWVILTNRLEHFVQSGRLFSRVRDDRGRPFIRISAASVMPICCLYVEITG